MRSLWPDLIHTWRNRPSLFDQWASSGGAIQRLIDNGANAVDIGEFGAQMALDTIFAMLTLLDEGYDPEAPNDNPGWRLMETDPNGRLTGRNLRWLHEIFLSLDPTGEEGQDLFDW